MDSLPKAHAKQNNLLDAINVYNTTFYNWITKQKGDIPMKRIVRGLPVVLLLLLLLTSCTGGNSSKKDYDMPKKSESFSDYVQRVDPELYDTMKDNYESAIGG